MRGLIHARDFVALLFVGLLFSCAPNRPEIRTASNLASIARDLLDQGQKHTALAVLQNARNLDPQSKEIASLIARAESTKEPPPRSVSLPYQLAVQGVEMTFESAYVNSAAEGWDQVLPATLEKDEIWLVIQGRAYAKAGEGTRSLPWRPVLRVIARHGQSFAPEGFVRSGAPGSTRRKDQLGPEERIGIKLFFRLQKTDFPVQLKFSDGATIDFATLSGQNAASATVP
jgi:hypothetical protein